MRSDAFSQLLDFQHRPALFEVDERLYNNIIKREEPISLSAASNDLHVHSRNQRINQSIETSPKNRKYRCQSQFSLSGCMVRTHH